MTKTAIISVFDKTNIEQVANDLIGQGYTILSTGGTYKYLAEHVSDPTTLVQVSDFTGFPEILGGRVKTLHPKIYGGILTRRDISEHVNEMNEHDIPMIDVVVCNLYPFHRVDNETEINEACELIDIGGVTLIRAAAKNFKDVIVLTDPSDYDGWMDKDRRALATKAFVHTTSYDSMISRYMSGGSVTTRVYQDIVPLKYGCNPHQPDASMASINGHDIPFEVLNGVPGYINILDAVNAWQLVHDLRATLQMPAAASFKHTSPAGAAVASEPLSKEMAIVYNASADMNLLSTAYVKARNADPMSSFGDFIALSHEVDVETARVIKREVSDGIIAPGYSEEAFEILKSKKGGKYIIMRAKESLCPHTKVRSVSEYREMYGFAVKQSSNVAITDRSYFEKVVTQKTMSDQALVDLIVANTALKYAQSNSVCFAKDGQVIGLGAGQQSRVDCVKLAMRKAKLWYLRQHPKCIALYDIFKPNTKRQVKVNAIVRFIESDFTEIEYDSWKELFTTSPIHLTGKDKQMFLETLTDVSLASDAFFPFRDNIDHASKIGTKYVLQPGGSVADDEIIKACNEYKMAMSFSGTRVFTH